MSKHPREIVKKLVNEMEIDTNTYQEGNNYGCDYVFNDSQLMYFAEKLMQKAKEETLEQEIERLEKEEIENGSYEKTDSPPAYNKCLQDQISHLQQQLSEWRLMK